MSEGVGNMQVYADKTTKKLLRNGVFSLSTGHHDREARTFKEYYPFSVAQAIGLAFLLSILLYWLPIFGTMIAGYVCGRRAGTALRGAFCGLVAGIILFLIGYILIKDIFSAGTALRTIQDAVWTWILNANPVFASYCLFIAAWAEFIGRIFSSFLLAEPGNLVILVVFGYVGGAIAAQRYREIHRVSAEPEHKNHHKKRWQFFNARKRYEPEKYYYIKPDTSAEYHTHSQKWGEVENEKHVRNTESPVTNLNKISRQDSQKEKTQDVEYTPFSEDEYYILGKRRGAEENEQRTQRFPQKQQASRSNSIVERALKARGVNTENL